MEVYYLASGIVLGAVLAVVLRGVLAINTNTHSEIKQCLSIQPIKAILLVRTDLKMGKGKIVAQGLHGAYAAGKDLKNRAISKLWASFGFKKVALQVSSEEEMKRITDKLKGKKIPIYPIVDAGRTQVEPNTWTVTFAGPYFEKEIDEVTGELKLL